MPGQKETPYTITLTECGYADSDAHPTFVEIIRPREDMEKEVSPEKLTPTQIRTILNDIRGQIGKTEGGGTYGLHLREMLETIEASLKRLGLKCDPSIALDALQNNQPPLFTNSRAEYHYSPNSLTPEKLQRR